MKRIFLLEDDAALNRGITMALTGSDRAVTQAVSFTEAREILAAAQFDLHILDINLPDGSGLELLRLMRQNGDQTPVILLTANDLELDEVTGAGSRGGRLYHKALLAGGAPRPSECPAAAVRSGRTRTGRTGRVFSLTLHGWNSSGTGSPLTCPRPSSGCLRLVENRGRTLPREQLLEQVWDNTRSSVRICGRKRTVRRGKTPASQAGKMLPSKRYMVWGYTWEVGR